jgi:hypothetical protein
VNSVASLCAEEIAPKQKTPRFTDARRKCGANFRSLTIGADFYCPAQDINLPYELMPRHWPVYEPTDNKE